MIEAGIDPKSHLGDKIISCIILFSVSFKIGESIIVNGCDDTKKIIKLFNFNNLIPNYKSEVSPNLSFKSFLPKFKFSKVKWLNIPFIYLGFSYEIKSLLLPKNEINYGDKKTYFQVDNRSSHKSKISLSKIQKINFILKKSKYNTIGIGGKDTKKDMPFPYHLGDLETIISSMKSAAQFVGVDSGMSHVAGLLGVPSEIFITHRDPEDIKDIIDLYSMLYDKTNCHGLIKTFL